MTTLVSSINRHLWTALDFKLSELLRVDLAIGVLFGVAALALSFTYPDAVLRAAPGAIGVVGVIVGAVVAGISFQAAFMDQAFLRKIRAIGMDPVYFLAPFLFTAVLGVVAMLGLIVLAALSPKAPEVAIAVVSTPTALITTWSIASLVPGMATLVQFVGLKMDALDVPDEIGHMPPGPSRGP
ncbi:hypothetical protein ABTW72_05170 [Micromonospora sp. NPDC127501]|uniref:hypothetical protein n=1 Tax=Micromonospora sp. NPDC127501 TaxID=3154872 RepID=UPI003324A03C